MADVEMSDAPVAKKADGVSAKGSDKKKFEVKKVRWRDMSTSCGTEQH